MTDSRNDEIKTLQDALHFLAPPIELIDVLESWAQRKPLPPTIAAYVTKWRTIRTSDATGIAMLDGDKQAA